MLLLISAFITLPAAALMSWWALRYAQSRNMLDIPGDRSLHSTPTPRGGGLAIAGCVLGGAVILTAIGEIPMALGLSLTGGGVIVAGLGWLDDRSGLPAGIRAVGYLVAAGVGVWFSGALTGFAIGSASVELGWAGVPLTILGIVWITNLYNFMDGADGIAAAQGIGAGLYAACLFAVGGLWGSAALCLIIAAACAGFLIFNWPPARLFMGDVGSCLLGYSFGVLVLHGEQSGAVPLPAWMLLLLVFIVDATLTLIRRLLRGEKWYSAHRTHAYQLLVQSGLGHRGVLLRFMFINFLILGPLALFTSGDSLSLVAIVVTLISIWFWCRAQRRHGMI